MNFFISRIFFLSTSTSTSFDCEQSTGRYRAYIALNSTCTLVRFPYYIYFYILYLSDIERCTTGTQCDGCEGHQPHRLFECSVFTGRCSLNKQEPTRMHAYRCNANCVQYVCSNTSACVCVIGCLTGIPCPMSIVHSKMLCSTHRVRTQNISQCASRPPGPSRL